MREKGERERLQERKMKGNDGMGRENGGSRGKNKNERKDEEGGRVNVLD